jgi:hypothetical protein
MATNLLKDTWTDLVSAELRLLLDERIGRPGQYDDAAGNPDVLYLPLAGAKCRVSLTFRDKKIAKVEPGKAFSPGEWERISREIESSLLTGPTKVGRDFSFSTFRVQGSWRGVRSGVQILPPPDDAPRAPVEIAQHPFVLEFPLKESHLWQITNFRRIREHRRLTLLLGVLLAGRTSLQPRRFDHFWASVDCGNGRQEIKWLQQFFIANLGDVVQDNLSQPAAEQLAVLDPSAYYKSVGHDGKGLRVPADLDESICRYMQLSPENREKFDRAAFWKDMASRQWNISMSLSFTALVLAVESLINTRGRGSAARFRDFVERFAPGATLAPRRNQMYQLRSDILHGSGLMMIDQDIAFGWDPPYWQERELHEELWHLTRLIMRNWLKDPKPTRKNSHIPSEELGCLP